LSDSAREKGGKPKDEKKSFGRPLSFPQRQHHKKSISDGTSQNKKRYVIQTLQSRSSNVISSEAIRTFIKCCQSGVTLEKTSSQDFPTKTNPNRSRNNKEPTMAKENMEVTGQGRPMKAEESDEPRTIYWVMPSYAEPF
jgi:hypothetical protein